MGKENQKPSDDWLADEAKDTTIGDPVLDGLLHSRERIYELWNDPNAFRDEPDLRNDLPLSMGVIEGKIRKRKHELGIEPTEEP